MRDRSRADHWSRRARAEGYPARSVYKLEEIVGRTPILVRGGRVLDLGCAPGSWGRYAARVCGPGAVIVGVDLQAVEGWPGPFVRASVEEVTPAGLLELLGGPADAVICDMAPATTGDRQGDHYRQIALAERALELAAAVLRPGGSFVVKVFDGADAPAYTRAVASRFSTVRRMKPKAVRAESVEFYLVATGFRPPG